MILGGKMDDNSGTKCYQSFPDKSRAKVQGKKIITKQIDFTREHQQMECNISKIQKP